MDITTLEEAWVQEEILGEGGKILLNQIVLKTMVYYLSKNIFHNGRNFKVKILLKCKSTFWNVWL